MTYVGKCFACKCRRTGRTGQGNSAARQCAVCLLWWHPECVAPLINVHRTFLKQFQRDNCDGLRQITTGCPNPSQYCALSWVNALLSAGTSELQAQADVIAPNTNAIVPESSDILAAGVPTSSTTTPTLTTTTGSGSGSLARPGPWAGNCICQYANVGMTNAYMRGRGNVTTAHCSLK